eukprot:6705942-Prymnesium_polylepis.1
MTDGNHRAPVFDGEIGVPTPNTNRTRRRRQLPTQQASAEITAVPSTVPSERARQSQRASK